MLKYFAFCIWSVFKTNITSDEGYVNRTTIISCILMIKIKYQPIAITCIQGSICRGGLTPPLVVDDPLTGDRQFWSGGVGFDPPYPLQQDQTVKFQI